MQSVFRGDVGGNLLAMEKLSPASLGRYLPAVVRFYVIAILGLVATVRADLELCEREQAEGLQVASVDRRMVMDKSIEQQRARSEPSEGKLQETKMSLTEAEKLWFQHAGLAELPKSLEKADTEAA
jgi:hypothetical protein